MDDESSISVEVLISPSDSEGYIGRLVKLPPGKARSEVLKDGAWVPGATIPDEGNGRRLSPEALVSNNVPPETKADSQSPPSPSNSLLTPTSLSQTQAIEAVEKRNAGAQGSLKGYYDPEEILDKQMAKMFEKLKAEREAEKANQSNSSPEPANLSPEQQTKAYNHALMLVALDLRAKAAKEVRKQAKTDKEAVERMMQGKLRARRKQKPVNDGLFDVSGRSQMALFPDACAKGIQMRLICPPSSFSPLEEWVEFLDEMRKIPDCKEDPDVMRAIELAEKEIAENIKWKTKH